MLSFVWATIPSSALALREVVGLPSLVRGILELAGFASLRVENHCRPGREAAQI
jgi:hypothetical protein